MQYKILDIMIKNELDKNKRIAIYPFGEIGMQVRDILEKRYGREAILIDNRLKSYNPKVIGISDFIEIDSEDITLVLCTISSDLNEELYQQVKSMNLKASLVNVLQSKNAMSAGGRQSYPIRKHCVLQRKAENCGLFSYFMVFLGGINYCIKNNLIPIIDMQSYENIYGGGRINSWELFFEQPMGIGLEKAENPIYLDCDEIEDRLNTSMDVLTNEKKISYWRKLCRQYIKFSRASKLHIDSCMKQYMPDNRVKQTVGVLCRGTDYRELKPYGHPVQPDVSEMIVKVSEFIEQHQCKYVYLATEDEYIWNMFSDKFGEKLIVTDMARYEDTGGAYLADVIRGMQNIDKKGMDYLASVYMLSRCKYLIAGRTSGSIAALVLSDGYDEVYWWNEGYYGEDV